MEDPERREKNFVDRRVSWGTENPEGSGKRESRIPPRRRRADAVSSSPCRETTGAEKESGRGFRLEGNGSDELDRLYPGLEAREFVFVKEKGEWACFPFSQFPFSPILEQRLIADLEESLVP